VADRNGLFIRNETEF